MSEQDNKKKDKKIPLNAKLTEDQVIEIRVRHAEGAERLSYFYGVTKGTIRKIIACRTWNHI